MTHRTLAADANTDWAAAPGHYCHEGCGGAITFFNADPGPDRTPLDARCLDCQFAWHRRTRHYPWIRGPRTAPQP